MQVKDVCFVVFRDETVVILVNRDDTYKHFYPLSKQLYCL